MLFNIPGGSATVLLAALLARGRRALTMGLWFAGLALSLTALAASGPGVIAMGAAGFAVGAFVSSASLMLYGLAPAFYTVSIRGAGTGAAVAVGRGGAGVGPLMAAALLTAGAGATGVLLSLLPPRWWRSRPPPHSCCCGGRPSPTKALNQRKSR